MMSTYRAESPEELRGQHDGCRSSKARTDKVIDEADEAASSHNEWRDV